MFSNNVLNANRAKALADTMYFLRKCRLKFFVTCCYAVDYGPASMGTTTFATTVEKHFKTAFTITAVVRMENGEFALTRVVYPTASNQCVLAIYIYIYIIYR